MLLGGRLSSSIGAVGIDLGTRAIKMLQVREASDGVKVVGAARIDAVAGRDLAPGPEQFLSAFSSGGFTGRRCVVSLPRADVFVQSIRLPRMPDREIRQAVAWEAAQRFDLDREAMEVDYIQTGAAVHGAEDREETLLIAASHETLDRRLEPLLDAGLRPVAVETDFVALARAVSQRSRRDADRSAVRAVVEIGATGSSVMILQGGGIRFYKPLSTRGSDLTRAVTDHLQIDEEAAAELRIARITAAVDQARARTPLDGPTDRAVYEAVRPLLNDLVKEVVLCLRYYGVTFRGQPPGAITLAGGDSLEPHLDYLLEQACKMGVGFDDARGTMRGLIGQIQTSLNRAPGPVSSWPGAAGLSLRGMSRRRGRARSGRGDDERVAA